MVPGRRILATSTAFGNPLLVEAQKLGSEARSVARVELVDHEGPLALIAVDDPAFWEGLEPLPLETRAAAEGAVVILRWQRTGLLDAYPGTLRQVRSGRHGLSQTSLLTIDVASSAEGLGRVGGRDLEGQGGRPRHGPQRRRLLGARGARSSASS